MGFDFRDLCGGASAKVENDPVLADGATADWTPGLCGHRLAQVPDIDSLVELIARSLVATANCNGLCPGAMVGLIVERIGQYAEKEVDAHQREHFMAEVAMRLGYRVDFDAE